MSLTRIGLFGIGLDTYWPQFPGLKERLEGYLATVHSKLAREGVEIVNLIEDSRADTSILAFSAAGAKTVPAAAAPSEPIAAAVPTARVAKAKVPKV